MRKLIKYFLGLLLFAVITLALFLGWKEYEQRKERAAYLATLRHTAADNVQTLTDTILIDYLGENRTLFVYLPPGYETDTARYPVLYFFDGTALFDEKVLEGPEWQVDEVLNSAAAGAGPRAIVIGIAEAKEERLTEYKPFLSPELPREKKVTGAEHMEWAATDLKDWVDRNYRTLPDRAHTTIGGCSLSGLMAYYGIMTYPDVYGGAFVFSPSFWVNDTVFSLHRDRPLREMRIYFGSGEHETPIVEGAERMVGTLIEAGMPPEQIRSDVFAEEGHSHPTWRKAFARAYPWVLGHDSLQYVPMDSLNLLRTRGS